MKTIFSPIPNTEFLVMVLMMVVMLNSRVILVRSSSMTSDALRVVRPEFGLSQKRYFGFITMARAIATRFAYHPKSHQETSVQLQSGSHGQDIPSLFVTFLSSHVREHIQWETYILQYSERVKEGSTLKIIPISRRMRPLSSFVMLTKFRPS